MNIRDGYYVRGDEAAKGILNPYLLGPMVCAAATDDDKDPSEKKEVDDDDESWITRKELFETINSVRIVFI